jgi:hypothetical protein
MSKKPMHPPFPRMVCEAMHGLDAMETTPEVQHHGHSMQSIKKYMGEHYKVCLGSSATSQPFCACVGCALSC